MGSAQQSTPRAIPNQVIVHHLSDLNYEENTNSTNNKLLTYLRYLEGLPDPLYPDVVVITGNLTKNGTVQELQAVSNRLVAGFSRWDGHLREHIFIVPGPQDINWQWDILEKRGISLAAFYTVFEPFATPAYEQPSAVRTPGVVESEDWIGYLIDTCYSPKELDATLKKHFKTYAGDFGRSIRRRGKVGSKFLGMWKRPWRFKKAARNPAREAALVQLQREFLNFTESTRPLDLRRGRVTTTDIEEFKGWTGAYKRKVQAAILHAASAQGPYAPVPNVQAANGATRPPLKILITHHPINIPANEKSAPADEVITSRSFTRLLEAARAAEFHLALHGHHHNEDVIVEVSTLQEPGTAKEIRQYGAASLDQTSMFNELTAIYREDQNQASGQSSRPGKWEFTRYTVNLSAAGPVAPRGTPGNVTTVADKTIRQMTRDAKQRREFETMLRFSMRRFGEQVWSARQERLQGGAPKITTLPQEALFLIRDVISGVIFKGYETHVRLLLKNIPPSLGSVPRLVPTYLTPAMMEGTDTLIYPASIAAWSLVLGRNLVFSEIDRNDIQPRDTEPEDHEWLRQSSKIDGLIQALKELETDATNTNATDEAGRYSKLRTDLLDIKAGPLNAPNANIQAKTMFRKPPDGSPLRGWPTFICLPYPIRPIGGAKPTLPEIAVLEVGVRPMEPPDPEDTTPRPAGPFKPFTDERVEMLEVVTDLIGMMLTTADALGRPPGAWS